jgi:Na+-driven multidrug efflux pump
MKIPKIPNKELWRSSKVNYALWLIFKLGILFGAGILIFGTILTSLFNPQHSGNQVPPQISVTANIVMALACIALSLNFLLEGYVFALKSPKKSLRSVINRFSLFALAAILLGAVAISLGILAIKEWLQL